jgi:adenine deaminase
MNSFSIDGNIVDVIKRRIFTGTVQVKNDRIVAIKEVPELKAENYIIPGFVDAHVHIESSMLIPSEFARLAVVHGTVATVSDPHEIANVCGMKGIEFMIQNGKTVPFKFNFGAPSCVPATIFETAGAEITANDIEELMQRNDVLYLSEMMNFPGVLNDDEEVLKKITAAKKYNKPIDGHAPGLRGEVVKKYIDAGISTDHECFTKEEALDKLQYEMKIIIREGSAAKNFEALIDLLNDYPDKMMFCSDDKHPDSLVEGHINQLCQRAVGKGIDVFKVLQAACVNPVLHYNLKVGLLRENDFADFIVIEDLKEFKVLQTYINGQLVAENGKTLIERKENADSRSTNNFKCRKKKIKHFSFPSHILKKKSFLPVIEALDGQLITNRINAIPRISGDNLVSDIDKDILKIVVVNRYKNKPVAKAFIKNFGLKRGAIASSVAHDSHNIVAVGTTDESICEAVNEIIESKGGICCIDGGCIFPLPLEVAGLMSCLDGYKVADQYAAIDQYCKTEMGCTLSAPFMTLSFMALLVIPYLKLSDKGLFDGDEFKFINEAF